MRILLIFVAFWCAGCAGLAAVGAITGGMENPGYSDSVQPVEPADDTSINRPVLIGTPLNSDTTVWRENDGLLAPPPGSPRLYCTTIDGAVYCR